MSTQNGGTKNRGITTFLGVLASAGLMVGCGTEGTESPTPGTNTPLDARFLSLTEGAQVSQVVALEIQGTGGGGIASLSFVAPASLVGIDTDPAPENLAASWDTTLSENGSVTVTVEAKGLDGTSIQKSITLTTANIDAAIDANYEDESYVRQGAPLLVNVKASAFGASPSLARIEVRALSGGGLTPALPIQGVSDGVGGFNFNLGTPTSGAVEVLFNAFNNAGEISAPLILNLDVLRNDIVSGSILSDFEVTRDGATGLLLGSVQGTTDMRLEFLNLADPANPTFSGAALTLQTGLTSTATGAIGNVLINPADQTKAVVLFPGSKQVYKIDVATKTVALKTSITSLPRAESGTGLQELNRSPYAVSSPDGNYIYAWDTTPTGLFIVIRTSDMVQLGVTQGQVTSPYPPPVTTNTKGFGYMAVHPTGRLVYAVNNWGYDSASAADLAVFDVAAQAFVDFNATTTRVVDAYSIENTSSSYKAAQQPAITKDGTKLLIPICNTSTGATVLKRLRIDPNAPTSILAESNVDLSSVFCGGIAAISPDDRYVVVASSSANKPSGAVVDLSTGIALAVTFPNGIKDAVFSADGTRVFAESAAFVNRDMGELILNVSPLAVESVLVPGASGLVPPDSDAKLRNHLMVLGGNYVYQLYPAYVNDGTGTIQTKGTSLSVFSIGLDGFVFPNQF